MEQKLLNQEQTRAALGGIGRTTYFELLKAEELRTVNIGRRRLVLAESVDEYVARLSDKQRADEGPGETSA